MWQMVLDSGELGWVLAFMALLSLVLVIERLIA